MIARFWRFLVLLTRALAACRISLISVAVGVALFWIAPQAQNLFADLSFHHWLHWPWFFVAVFFVWAFPVHYGARRVLCDRGWLVSHSVQKSMPTAQFLQLRGTVRREMKGVITWLPRVLGLAPFFAIGLGMALADESMDGVQALPEAAAAHRQIQGLLAANVVVAALFWLFVVYRRPMIRRALARAKSRGSSGAWSQTALKVFAKASLAGTALVFFIAYFFPHALAALIPRALLVPFLLGTLVLLLSLLVRRGYRHGAPVLTPILALCAFVTATNPRFNDVRTLDANPDKDKRRIELQQRQIELRKAVALWRAANHCSGREDCPPALIVAAEGGASRAAFMAATLIGEIIDRTRVEGRAPGRLIFAISGVSGGAFGAATIRAALADASESDGAPPCKVVPRTWFGHDRPGARSPTESWRSCLQTLVSGDYLSSGLIGLGFRDTVAPREWFFGKKSWIDDRAALLEQSWEAHFDHVAGRSLRFGSGIPCREGSDKGLCRRLGYASQQSEGGWLPLLVLNGASVETGRRIIATDLVSTLQIPGVAPGSLSRATLYSAAYDLFEMTSTPCAEAPAGLACPLASPFPEDAPDTRDGPDVRLSTAALISARFPIISPAGTLRTRGREDRGDRVVDGGYFENAGLTSAIDLAEALRTYEDVSPAILWISNDPISAGEDVALLPRPAATPDVGALDASLVTRMFGVLSSPANALFATRQGHGAEAADLADRSLARLNGWEKHGFFKIGVRAQPIVLAEEEEDARFSADCGALAGQKLAMPKVSMSWWLSSAVQANLDAQLCDCRNRRDMRDLVAFLGPGK